MKTLNMPSFGADMETGKVIEWCFKPGDKINKGDVVALIETAKGLIDMEAFEDCTLLSYLVPINEDVPVGKPIMQLVGTVETVVASPASETSQQVSLTAELTAAPDAVSPIVAMGASITPSQEVLASPAAKLLAVQNQIKLSALNGTGVDGAVCLKDIEVFLKEIDKITPANLAPGLSDETPARQAGIDAEAMRQAIAAVVSKSKREIPHYYLSLDIDVTTAEKWLDQINAERPPEQRLLINAPVMCAVSRALHKHPDFNGCFQNKCFKPAASVHLGIAIRLRNKGLVTPAIHNAETLTADAMMAKLKSVVERAKLGGLKQSELQDATMTLSNIGDRGSDQIFGVIFPPQVAIIGVGRVVRKALVIDGNIEARTVVNISLAADHRVSDGYMGARFLNEIGRLLQQPAQFTEGKP